MSIPFLLVLGIVFVALFASALAGLSFAPWVPSRRRDYERALALSELRSREVLYDLGCGDGRFLFFAASRISVCAKGIELVFPLVWLAKFRALRFAGPGTVGVRWGDFFGVNVSDADVVFLFGMPKMLAGKVRMKLVRELRPGARIVSYYFPLDGLVPEDVSYDAAGQSPLYRYRIGGREA
jgi:SAM-dependent methyltransferase